MSPRQLRNCTASDTTATSTHSSRCPRRLLFGLALALALAPASRGLADELADKGRRIFEKYRRAVLTVQIVVKSKVSMGGMGGQANETRQNVAGTVISPEGLTVLSLSATDPSQLVRNMMSSDESKFKLETELSDIKLLLEDGAELPAEVVLRDRDLDLAFVRPKTKPPTQLESVDLSKFGKARLLDQVVSLNRLGNAAGRAFSASVERISAVVEKPRLFYVPETSQTMTALGAPAFTLDGDILGLFLIRSSTGGSRSAGSGMFGPQSENFTGIILPAAAIANAAKQVPAPGEEKEKEQ